MHASKILFSSFCGGWNGLNSIGGLQPLGYFQRTVNKMPRSWFEVSWLIHHNHINLIGRRPDLQVALDERMKSVTPENLKSRLLRNKEWSITPNEFPYWMNDNIQHRVLWSDRIRDAEEIDVYLQTYLKQPYLWFRNPTHLQSVTSIYHVQVFTDTEQTRIIFE